MNEEYLINYLEKYNNVDFEKLQNDRDRIRALMNITTPVSLSEKFYKKQDIYLQNLLKEKTIVNIDEILGNKQIVLFLGDITTIKADTIVNAGNSDLLGCFAPLHYCIDNAIHSFGGLQIRRDLMNLMKGRKEANGKCKVTRAYNLPCKYVFHTVGPIFNGVISKQMEIDLTNCYLSCLQKADEMKLNNIVFCSISTGIFGFPIEQASNIAINTVKEYINKTNSKLKVVFDLFSKKDYEMYEKKLKR